MTKFSSARQFKNQLEINWIIFKILRQKPWKPNIKFEKENRQKPLIQFQFFIFYETRLFTERCSRTTTIHPGIFGGRAL